MTTQSEAILENNLIKQLIGLGYASAKIMEGAALVSVYRRTTKNRYLLIGYRYQNSSGNASNNPNPNF
jgi:hypothetical protein